MKKARDIRKQIEELCERVEIDDKISSPNDNESILKAITPGFFYDTAKLGKSGEYQIVKQHRTVYIHPGCVWAKEEELRTNKKIDTTKLLFSTLPYWYGIGGTMSRISFGSFPLCRVCRGIATR